MRESEMKDKGNLSQSIEDKIQIFWEWYNQNKDILIENNDKLKITFKVTATEPLVFKLNNIVIAITEHYDIYEVA